MVAENAGVAAGAFVAAGRWWSWSAWAVALVCVILVGPLVVVDRWQTGRWAEALVQPFVLVLPLLGALVAARRRTNPVGWLLLGAGVATAVGVLSEDGRVATVSAEPTGGGALLSEAAFAIGLPLLLLALLLFPDGRPPSKRWWPVVGVLLVAAWARLAAAMVGEWPEDLYPGIANPLGVPAASPLAGPTWFLTTTLINAAIPVTAVSLLVRFRGADPVRRAQLQWVLLPLLAAGVALVGLLALSAFATPPPLAEQFVVVPLVVGVPVGAAIGILRHQLLDIELLVNRSLVFALVWVGLLGVYAATVVVLGDALSERAAWLPPVVATVVLVVAFDPLRVRVQRLVDRRLFGHRSDPYELKVRLDRSAAAVARETDTGQMVVDTLAASLRLPYVGLTLADGTEAEAGRVGTPTVEVPLVHAGEEIGRLTVAQRSPREPFLTRELRLLDDLATQAAIALRAARAAQELRAARTRMVGAVEDERRRLRRDLHDGVGARLTGLSFAIRAAHNRLDDPGAAAQLLDQVSEDLQQTLTEVRGLVHDLRPPVLDDLGLVAAIEQRVRRVCDDARIRLSVEAPAVLPELPASVETAVYRIAVEACTNVVRHAEASVCSLRLRTDGVLTLEIADDGVGIRQVGAPGVGIAAMRERAEEVGGTFEVTSSGGGTTVRLTVPPTSEFAP